MVLLRAPSDTYNSLGTLIEIDNNWMTTSLLETAGTIMKKRKDGKVLLQ